MGLCHGKPTENSQNQSENTIIPRENEPALNSKTGKSSKFPFYSPSPLANVFKNSPAYSGVSSTPLRIFKRPFPPPSPAKHIRALLARRHGSICRSKGTGCGSQGYSEIEDYRLITHTEKLQISEYFYQSNLKTRKSYCSARKTLLHDLLTFLQCQGYLIHL